MTHFKAQSIAAGLEFQKLKYMSIRKDQQGKLPWGTLGKPQPLLPLMQGNISGVKCKDFNLEVCSILLDNLIITMY